MSEQKKENGNQILDNIRFSTTKLIVTKNSGGISIGTGFFFYLRKNETYVWPLLVTNKHIIADWKFVSFNVLKADQEGNPLIGDSEKITIQNSDGSWISHPNVDLSIFPINCLIEKNKNLA